MGCLSSEGRAGLDRAGSARAAGHGVVASRGEGRGCGELVERQGGADWGEPVGARRFWPEGATRGEARWRRRRTVPPVVWAQGNRERRKERDESMATL